LSAEALTMERSARWADFVTLSKPRLTLMVVLTTAVGFLLAAPRPLAWALLWHAVAGTALVAAGAQALNQVIERRTDALMRRTADRPLPSGRMQPETALLFGVALAVSGMLYLALSVNLATAVLGAVTLTLYLAVYTPMKRLTSLATLVGAVPGAVPPMMGCSAATGELGPLAWILFGILFLWQMPHFLSIAWLYRHDYERGGFPMLTHGPGSGVRTARQMVLYAAALVPVSVLPSVFGFAGLAYFAGAIVLGLAFVGYSFGFGRAQNAPAARRLMLASLVYLPLVLLLMVADQSVP
jgi:protoheme IX farnesyltransferase